MLDLLRTSRFAPLFWTQFLGALNDNLFKSALVAALTFRLIDSGLELSLLVNFATAALVLPFFLFSAIAGELADARDKARFCRILKSVEIGVMGLAAFAFVVGSLPLLFVALFSMGAQSAFFGPIKYAILPQHLDESELVGGNALIETATFIAIVGGTVLGTLLASMSLGAVGGFLTVLAVAGRAAASRVPAAPPEDGVTLKIRGAMKRTLCSLRSRSLTAVVIAISAFWLVGAVLLAQLPELCQTLGATGEWDLALALTAFSAGIGVGSVLAERLAHRLGRIALGTLGPAALLMALSLSQVAFAADYIELTVALAFTGALGGVFVVPLYAEMQRLAKPEERARVIAANNILNALFIVVGSAYAAARLNIMEAELSRVILEMAIFTVLLGVGATIAKARATVHASVRVLVRVLYRIDVDRSAAVPSEGRVIVVANHQSFFDAFILAAFIERPTRFVMDHRMAKLPILRGFFRFARVIPIAPKKEDPAVLQSALDAIDAALHNDEVVILFPEGCCTRDGAMNDFRPGVARIVERLGIPVPIVPVGLDGLWGGFFSYAGGPPMASPPKRFRAQVRMRFGEVTMDPSPESLQAKVRELLASHIGRRT